MRPLHGFLESSYLQRRGRSRTRRPPARNGSDLARPGAVSGPVAVGRWRRALAPRTTFWAVVLPMGTASAAGCKIADSIGSCVARVVAPARCSRRS